MSTLEDSSEGATPEIVGSLFTRDTGGNIILCLPNEDDEIQNPTEPLQKRFCLYPEVDSNPCMPIVDFSLSENNQSFEEAMTITTDVADELTERNMIQIKTLQNSKPDGTPPLGNGNSVINQGWFTDKEDKYCLSRQGHKWKMGMWSKEEIDILTNNIECYMKARGIKDVSEFIFKMSKGKRKDFYRTVAWGLNRPLFAVYRRVIRMYDDRNHVGKYTPEESERLKSLWHQHGNDWTRIGAALGRSASSVKDRCRLVKDTYKMGKWTEEEERRLAEVVHELTSTNPGEKVTRGVPWTAVAQRICTRSAKQCRSKWLNYLNWKQTGGIEWTREDEVTLILRLAELDVADESDIHWDLLAKGWSSVRSPQWLRSKWWTIKRQVSNHKDVTFPVLVKCLQKLYENQNTSLMLWDNKSRYGVSEGNPDSQVQHVPIRVPSLEGNPIIDPVPITAFQIAYQINPVSGDSPSTVKSEAITVSGGSQ